MRPNGILPTILLITALAGPALGAEEESSRWRLGAAFGYGERSNPLIQSEDIPIVVDLDIAWFGDRWFFDNGDLGLTFADNARLTGSLVARFNSDRVFFGRTDTRFVSVDTAGAPLAEATLFSVPDRDFAIELGVELLSDVGWGQLQASAFHDVSDTHGGYELFIDYSRGWRNQRWYLEPSIGASYKSEDLNDYYWGVAPDEANDVLPEYRVAAGLNWHGRIVLSYQLSRQWQFSMVAEYERLNAEAAASPLVETRNVTGYFAGFGFRFR